MQLKKVALFIKLHCFTAVFVLKFSTLIRHCGTYLPLNTDLVMHVLIMDLMRMFRGTFSGDAN